MLGTRRLENILWGYNYFRKIFFFSTFFSTLFSTFFFNFKLSNTHVLPPHRNYFSPAGLFTDQIFYRRFFSEGRGRAQLVRLNFRPTLSDFVRRFFTDFRTNNPSQRTFGPTTLRTNERSDQRPFGPTA